VTLSAPRLHPPGRRTEAQRWGIGGNSLSRGSRSSSTSSRTAPAYRYRLLYRGESVMSRQCDASFVYSNMHRIPELGRRNLKSEIVYSLLTASPSLRPPSGPTCTFYFLPRVASSNLPLCQSILVWIGPESYVRSRLRSAAPPKQLCAVVFIPLPKQPATRTHTLFSFSHFLCRRLSLPPLLLLRRRVSNSANPLYPAAPPQSRVSLSHAEAVKPAHLVSVSPIPQPDAVASQSL
jgi:hypothetical protein